MNKHQKLVQKQFLNDEETVIKRLEGIYNLSLKDITGKITLLDSSIADLQKAYNSITDDEIGDLAAAFLGSKANFTPEEARSTLQSMIQSKVYQKKYQEGLQKQVGDVLDKMQDKQFKTVSEYLDQCYENGFIGTMYDLQGQGIPLCLPIDQEQMVRAVQLDSKIRQGLYSRLGEDVSMLKRTISAEVSRGISTGTPFAQVAQQIKARMIGNYDDKPGGALYRAMTIARTEGHRIQVQSGMDACYKAKDMGADVVKQWDATLDGRTRESHAAVDGEIRELDEKFSNELMYPGDPSGGASEVVNCRCALLQRARWALDDEELQTLKDRAAFFGLDKTDNFEEYKKLYLKSAEQSAKMESEKISAEGQRLLDKLKSMGVDINPVKMHSSPLSNNEIISALAGGDRTSGSCASVGLAYCGQKSGMDVLDFRGGKSLDFFSHTLNLREISKLPGMETFTEIARSSVTAGNRLLKKVANGKEYYFVSGRHAAIVRRTDDGILQYLELQSPNRSGWTNFDGNPRYTLHTRFGETKGYDVECFMIDVDSMKDSGDIRSLLGYINTAENEQRKGKYGTIK